MDDVAILSYTKMNNANIVNDSMPIAGVGGIKNKAPLRCCLCLFLCRVDAFHMRHICDPHLLTLQNLMKFSMSMHFS